MIKKVPLPTHIGLSRNPRFEIGDHSAHLPRSIKSAQGMQVIGHRQEEWHSPVTKTLTMPQCLLQNIPYFFYSELISPPRIATDRDKKHFIFTIWNNCRGNIMNQLFATNIAVLHEAFDCVRAGDLQSKTGRAMRPVAPTSSRRVFFGGPSRSALPLFSNAHLDHPQGHADRDIKRLG